MLKINALLTLFVSPESCSENRSFVQLQISPGQKTVGNNDNIFKSISWGLPYTSNYFMYLFLICFFILFYFFLLSCLVTVQSPAPFVVYENAAALFCCDTPDMIFGTKKLHHIPSWNGGKYKKFFFHLWMNSCFKLCSEGKQSCQQTRWSVCLAVQSLISESGTTVLTPFSPVLVHLCSRYTKLADMEHFKRHFTLPTP